jgi:hypothetical protein
MLVLQDITEGYSDGRKFGMKSHVGGRRHVGRS